MALTVFGVKHSDAGLAKIQEAIPPHLPEGGLFDTVYAEFMNLPPLTDCSRLHDVATDEYERLTASVGRKVLSIDGCLIMFDDSTLRREYRSMVSMYDAVAGIRSGVEVSDQLHYDIEKLIRVQEEREHLMAEQLADAQAGVDQNDAVFIGAVHRAVVDHLRPAEFPITYVSAISPLEEKIIDEFLSFYGQDAFDINPRRFATLWMLLDMAGDFSPEQARSQVSLDESRLDELYRRTLSGYNPSSRSAPLEVDTIIKILSE